MVLTLLGNDWKIGLKWKQNSVLSRRYGYEEEDIEIIKFLRGYLGNFYHLHVGLKIFVCITKKIWGF